MSGSAAPPSPPRLVLASASPRRRELLSGLGVRFEQRPVDLDESVRPGEAPEAYVLRLAREKAAAGAAAGDGDREVVLAADTSVVLDGEILGKPADPAEARRMLARLSGREHSVLTGVALAEPGAGREVSEVTASRVVMAPLDADRVAWYVATGEPLDKAGSYAIQGIGALFVEEVYGSYTNVVGLPLPTVGRLFAALGYDLLQLRDGGSPGAA